MAYRRVTATTTTPRSGGDRQSVRHTRGSKVRVYKQDPSVSAIGVRTLWIPNSVRYGPRTDDVQVRGLCRRYGATALNDDFLYCPETEPEPFDAVSSLAMVQRTINMCRRSLRRSGRTEPLAWFWGTRPLQLWPRAGEMVNAFYHRDERSLSFYYFRDPQRDVTVYTCRSWDIVAHETGHAILDAIHPQWLLDSVDSLQTGALNESFGDLLAIFGALEQLDVCETVIAECKGDLTGPRNLLSCLGEEFGAACGLPYGIRNAQDDVTMSNAGLTIHDLSRVFTGAVYDSLVRIYESDSDLLVADPADTLHHAALQLLDTFLLAVVESPESRPTFRDVAERMVIIADNKEHKAVLTEEFGRRDVFTETRRVGPVRAGVEATVKACSTAQMIGDTATQPYLCGTLLAARDESVKAELSRSIHILSANYAAEDNEEGYDGSRGAIVHVPWHIP